ncbi:hypothetical protein [Methanobacterium aggregans]|uniref:hypothetical protein n=1 Tax=Methanobacterium aggregans TaxID=1615586 RepID=UPI001AE32E4E|nr:hypothetical protein [Methanobacterium aggregans]MBP2045953.1 hypothetical protein [Methanobacterium aggregans]
MDSEELEAKIDERQHTKEINISYIISFGAYFLGLYFFLKGYLMGVLGFIPSPVFGVYLLMKNERQTKLYGLLLLFFSIIWILSYINYMPT